MLEKLKREAYEANVGLPAHGLINLTFGNASAIDRASGIFAIKPSGVAYADLKPSDMVLIDLAGVQVEGFLRPSSDGPTHRRLYLAFYQIGGVVHTHSTYATAFAQAGKEIPVLGTTHADYFYGNVPVARKMSASEISGGACEWETGSVIAEYFACGDISPDDRPSVLVNRHAPFTWGKSSAKAVEVAVALECIAQMATITLCLDPSLGGIEPELLCKHFMRKHGVNVYYGQPGV